LASQGRLAVRDEGGFGSRLQLLLSKRFGTKASLAREAGISPSLVQKYIEGSEPGLSTVISIARAGSVSVEWLATGRGPGPDSDTDRDFRKGREAFAYRIAMVREIALAAGRPPDAPGYLDVATMVHDQVERDLDAGKRCPDLGRAAALAREKLAELGGEARPA
jgi:transcriptional regulator with XRE-family HTH domain